MGLFGGNKEGISEKDVERIIDKREKTLKDEIKREIKTSLTAFEIDLEQNFDEKLTQIAAGIQQIKDATSTDDLQDLLRKNSESSNAAVKAINRNLVKLEAKVDTAVNELNATKNEFDGKIQDVNSKVDAFVEVISEKLAAITKKKNEPLTSIYENDGCPFDNRIDSCEIWKNRIEINDAPAFCSACRGAAMLHKKGLSNVRIQQITTGNIGSAEPDGK